VFDATAAAPHGGYLCAEKPHELFKSKDFCPQDLWEAQFQYAAAMHYHDEPARELFKQIKMGALHFPAAAHRTAFALRQVKALTVFGCLLHR
jgi:hypothetical protein